MDIYDAFYYTLLNYISPTIVEWNIIFWKCKYFRNAAVLMHFWRTRAHQQQYLPRARRSGLMLDMRQCNLALGMISAAVHRWCLRNRTYANILPLAPHLAPTNLATRKFAEYFFLVNRNSQLVKSLLLQCGLRSHCVLCHSRFELYTKYVLFLFWTCVLILVLLYRVVFFVKRYRRASYGNARYVLVIFL